MKYLFALIFVCGVLCVRADESPQFKISSALASNVSLVELTQVLQENGDLMPYDDLTWLHVLEYLVRQSELPQYAHPNICMNKLNDPLGKALLQFSTRNYPSSMSRVEREALVFGETLNHNDRLRLIVTWNHLYQMDPMLQLTLDPDPVVDIVKTCGSLNASMGATLWRKIYSQKHCALLTPAIVNASFKTDAPKMAEPVLETLNRCWSAQEKLDWGLPIIVGRLKGLDNVERESVVAMTGRQFEELVRKEYRVISLHTWLLKPDTRKLLLSHPSYKAVIQNAKGDLAFVLWANELNTSDLPPQDWKRYCHLSDPVIQKALTELLGKHQLSCN